MPGAAYYLASTVNGALVEPLLLVGSILYLQPGLDMLYWRRDEADR